MKRQIRLYLYGEFHKMKDVEALPVTFPGFEFLDTFIYQNDWKEPRVRDRRDKYLS